VPEVKLTKNELRIQQNRLNQLQKYLPTLQLKKALLQLEVQEARSEIVHLEKNYEKLHDEVESYSLLISDRFTIDLTEAVKVLKVDKHFENVASTFSKKFLSLDRLAT